MQEAVHMRSLGVEPPCSRCGHPWRRGEIMIALETNDGEPAGWHCRECCEQMRKRPLGKRKVK